LTSEKEEIKNFKIPLRLMCRKSLAKHLEKDKELILHTSKCGIEYYENQFGFNYPFAKLD